MTEKLAEGCCSASLPCAHQKAHPESICDTCKGAAAIGALRDIATFRPDQKSDDAPHTQIAVFAKHIASATLRRIDG